MDAVSNIILCIGWQWMHAPCISSIGVFLLDLIYRTSEVHWRTWRSVATLQLVLVNIHHASFVISCSHSYKIFATITSPCPVAHLYWGSMPPREATKHNRGTYEITVNTIATGCTCYCMLLLTLNNKCYMTSPKQRDEIMFFLVALSENIYISTRSQ